MTKGPLTPPPFRDGDGVPSGARQQPRVRRRSVAGGPSELGRPRGLGQRRWCWEEGGDHPAGLRHRRCPANEEPLALGEAGTGTADACDLGQMPHPAQDEEKGNSTTVLL
jgi:hypothetical protein